MNNLESVLTREGTHEVHTLVVREALTEQNAFCSCRSGRRGAVDGIAFFTRATTRPGRLVRRPGRRISAPRRACANLVRLGRRDRPDGGQVHGEPFPFRPETTILCLVEVEFAKAADAALRHPG
jgi:hypothetical protein